MKKKAAKLNYFKFINEFEKHKKHSVFLIVGNDTYQRDKAVSLLKKEYTTPGTEDFDAVSMYGSSCQDNEVIEQLESLPFMSKNRFVLLKEVEKLKKKQLDPITSYLKSISKTTVFVVTSEKLDLRTAFAKALTSVATVVECKKPYNNSALMSWLDNELKSKRIRMDMNAKNMLINNIELDYLAAENELTKLILYTHGKDRISLEDVETTLGKSRESTIYDLQRALGSKNLKLSMQVLNNMLASEEAINIGVMLVAMLNRYFLTLWKIDAYRRLNYSDHEISQQHLHEVFYFFREEYISAARKYNLKSLRKVFHFLLKADTELKSVSMHETTLFLLIYRICNA